MTLHSMFKSSTSVVSLMVLASFTSASSASEEFTTSPAPGPSLLLDGFAAYNSIYDNDPDFDDEIYEFGIFGGWAGIAIPVLNDFGIQVEMFGESTTISDGETESDTYRNSFGAGGHLNWRDENTGLLGLMGGLVRVDTGDELGSENNVATGVLFGVEGQAYIGQTTLYGQVGYASFLGREGVVDNDFYEGGTFIRGVVRHFIDESTKLEGELGGMSAVFDSTDEPLNLINWGLEIERAIGDRGASIYARYDGIYADQPEEGDTTVDTTFKFGVRMHLDSDVTFQSAMYSDRHGVSLDLPDFGRWAGVSQGPIE